MRTHFTSRGRIAKPKGGIVKYPIAIVCIDIEHFWDYLVQIRFADRNNFYKVAHKKDLEDLGDRKFLFHISMLYTDAVVYRRLVAEIEEKHLLKFEAIS